MHQLSGQAPNKHRTSTEQVPNKHPNKYPNKYPNKCNSGE